MPSVLYNELMVPGWASEGSSREGLKQVTGIYGESHAFSLPCHNSDPEIFFAEDESAIEVAKSLCNSCPVRRQCLDGAISRSEPCGVWGGELFLDGEVIAKRKRVGRPRLVRV